MEMKNSLFSIFVNQGKGAILMIVFVSAINFCLSAQLQGDERFLFVVVLVIFVIVFISILINFILLVLALRGNKYIDGVGLENAQSDLLLIPIVGIWLAKNSKTIKKSKEILIKKRAEYLFDKAIESAEEGKISDATRSIALAKRYFDHNDSSEGLSWKTRFGKVVESIHQRQVATEIVFSKRFLCEAALIVFKKDNELWQSLLKKIVVNAPKIELAKIPEISTVALKESSEELLYLQHRKNSTKLIREYAEAGNYAAALNHLREQYSLALDWREEENDFLFT